MVNTDNAITWSLYFEGGTWSILGCAFFALAYIFLNETRIKAPQSTAVIYSKPLALLAGFASFGCAFVALIRAIGFDAVVEVIDNNSANTISGLKSYDLGFVSVAIWLFFMSWVVSLYNAFRDFTSHLYWITFVFWAMVMFLLYHATSWWAMFLLSVLGLVLLFANILSTIANSYVAFYLLDVSKWIMYTFYFGFQLTFGVITFFSCPYNIDNWGLMGQWFPEWIRWVLMVFATLVFTLVAIYSFWHRIPRSGDYRDFFPSDPAVPALNALIAQGQIVSEKDINAAFGGTGMDASRAMSSGNKFSSAKAWAVRK